MHLRHSIFRFVYLFLCDCGKLHSIAFSVRLQLLKLIHTTEPAHTATGKRDLFETFYFMQISFVVFVSPFIRLFVAERNRCRIVSNGTMVMPLFSSNSVRIFAHKRKSLASCKRHTFRRQMSKWSPSSFRRSPANRGQLSGCYRPNGTTQQLHYGIVSIKRMPYAPNNFHLYFDLFAAAVVARS